MCKHCGTDHELPEGVEDAYEEMIEEVKAFSPELRSLLIEETLTKVKDMIETSIAEDDPLKSKALLAVADNSLNLAGLANAHNRGDNEDWTATGDKRVSALWNKYVKMVTGMIGSASGVVAILAEDLPTEILERLESGDQTDADMEVIKAAMRANGADVPDDAEVMVHGLAAQITKAGESKTPTGTGLYL